MTTSDAPKDSTDVPRRRRGGLVLALAVFLGSCGLQESRQGDADEEVSEDLPRDADTREDVGDEEVCGALDLSTCEVDAADEVVAVSGWSSADLSLAEAAVNGVHGAGTGAGSTDVFSMGYAESEADSLVLRWSGRRVCNGPGVDFVVFENGFVLADAVQHFMDPVIVEVSQDGLTWVAFPHDYVAPDETQYSTLPEHWQGFAGLQPVLLNEETNPVDPFDATSAGGDPFDLDDLPDGEDAEAIRAEGFRFLRLVTAPSRVNPDTGERYVRDPISNGADIDGVFGRCLRVE